MERGILQRWLCSFWQLSRAIGSDHPFSRWSWTKILTHHARAEKRRQGNKPLVDSACKDKTLLNIFSIQY
jgi:hypothetical protein